MSTEVLILKLQELFAPVADKIGQGAEYGWLVVIKQMYVYAALGAFWAAFGVFVLLITNLAGYLWRKKAQELVKAEGRYAGDNWAAAGITVPIIGTIAGLVVFAIGSSVAITHYLNPDFYAIKFFIGLVSGNN